MYLLVLGKKLQIRANGYFNISNLRRFSKLLELLELFQILKKLSLTTEICLTHEVFLSIGLILITRINSCSIKNADMKR